MPLPLDQTRRDILNASGHLMVLGGPGSGKTTIALLKAQALASTLLPGQRLLFLSFSKAAVRQVLKSCEEHLSADDRRLLEVRTYHAFCIEILTSFGKLLNGRQVEIMYPLQERLEKAQFADDWDIETRRMAMEDSRFCFDQFAAGVAWLLEGSQSLLRLLSERYPAVVVDEFQDTDNNQWRIVRALATASSLFCLADPDQRIFDYRPEVDPTRLDTLRTELAPREFDLGGENNRSPHGDILAYANAVLQNTPIDQVKDVKKISYWPNEFEQVVHAHVSWLRMELASKVLGEPSVAVLTRTNNFAATVSSILTKEHSYVGRRIPPLEHDILWDAELSLAAGLVVASLLEWSCYRSDSQGVCLTLESIARFFELKGATSGSKTAYTTAKRYRSDSVKIREKQSVRRHITRQLLVAFESGKLELVGDPITDWRSALGVLQSAGEEDVVRNARMIRRFRATDTIGTGLAERWLHSGDYGGAVGVIESALSHERVAAVEQDHHGCIVMTMHKSKGKEFDGVVLVEGKYAGAFFRDDEQPHHLSSRRLLRVALTRARRKVVVLRPHLVLVQLTPKTVN